MSKEKQECPVATLSHVGRTCFLNSVLYTLRFAPTFLHNLHHLVGDLALINSRLSQNKAKSSSLGYEVGSISGPSSRSTIKDLLSLGNSDIPKLKVQFVTEKLHELFITMHNLELKDSGDPYQPLAFLQAVRGANYIFEDMHKPDAHEVLVYLLDNIRETCDFLTQVVENQPNLLNDPEKKIGYNFVAEDFEGITLRRTKCLECEDVSVRKEPFYTVPVPIISDQDCEANPKDIYKEACVTSEKLRGSNKYFCDYCKRYNEASRTVLFEKLPNIMVLQLKRFISTAAGVQKVKSYLPTPLELDCFCESCGNLPNGLLLHRYELCCVIMHLGETMAFGRYFSYVKITDHFKEYVDCSRDLPSGIGTSKTIDCCGIKLNKNVVENVFKSYAQERWSKSTTEDVWLQCYDDYVRPISNKEFQVLLGCKANKAKPYLLFYSKITDGTLLE